MPTATKEKRLAGNVRLVRPAAVVGEVEAPRSLEPFFKDPEHWPYENPQWYTHQIVGVRHLIERNSILLADDMGLGKTMQALAAHCADVKRGWSKRLLVVCPASLKSNWAEEVEGFTRLPYVKSGVTPPQRAKALQRYKELPTPNVFIINYEQVEGYLDELNALKFDLVIFDESHHLKNPEAKRTFACKRLITRRSFMVTGSPMLNDVSELWWTLDRIAPGEFGSFAAFKSQYAVFGGHRGQQIVGVKNFERLKVRIQNCMLQRKKEDVLDLPDVQFVKRTVELSKVQRRLYDITFTEMMNAYRAGLAAGNRAGDKQAAMNSPGVMFGRLLRLCGTTATLEDGIHGDHSEKLDLAVDDCVQLLRDGEPVVVFTRWRKVHTAFMERLRKAMPDHPAYEVTGDTPREPVVDHEGRVVRPDRVGTVRQWASEPEACAIVCMYQVAGTGLNMTHSKRVLRLDKLFVPDLNKQAVDRVNRIGASTTQPIQVWDYYATNTIERGVERILKSKSQDVDAVMNVKSSDENMMKAIIEMELENA